MQSITVRISFKPEIVRNSESIEKFRALVVTMLRKVLPTGLVEIESDV